jgi:hypothetical protein
MVGAYHTGEREDALVGKRQGKRPLLTPRQILEDDSVDRKEALWRQLDWIYNIWRRMGATDGLHECIFGLH